MVALGRYESGIHACGFHRSLTQDKSNRFTFEIQHCSVCAGSAVYGRMQHESDERVRAATKQEHRGDVPGRIPDPADGRTTYMRLLPPEDPLEPGGGEQHRHSPRTCRP